MLGFNVYKSLFTAINFFALLFLMKKFFFKPVLNILEERKAKIAAELAKASEATLEAAKLKETGEGIIIKAKQEAQVILKKAKKSADDLIAQAKVDADKVVQETRASIEREKEEIRQEMYATLIDLVAYASRKVLSETISEDYQRELIEGAVGQSLKQSYLRGMVN